MLSYGHFIVMTGVTGAWQHTSTVHVPTDSIIT
jgi:hypothetical protein